MSITGILLAAGHSVRFGSNKLLHPLVDGTPLAVLSARHLRQAVTHAVAVLRPNQYRLADLLRAEGFHLVPCESHGIGDSLAAAVKASKGASAWVVGLADMPFVQTETVVAVSAALQQGHRLVAPTYHGQRGHPVGFQRCFFTELSQLQGDQGARQILQKYAQHMTLLPCKDAGIVRDIDTCHDLPQSIHYSLPTYTSAYHAD